MNRRRAARQRRRLRVRLEPGGIRSVTGDLSPGGLFVFSHRVFPPGTPVRVEVELPDGTTAAAEGVVRWAKRVPGTLTAVARGGMGIQLTWVPEEVRLYLEDLYPYLAKTG